MDREPTYALGTEPLTVLASDLRDASNLGWTLLSDPQAIQVEGSRVIYRTSPDGGAAVPVAVLSPGVRFNKRTRKAIEASLRASKSRGLVRKVDVVTRSELARRLGCVEKTVDEYRKIPTFPKPFAKLGYAPIWDLREVRAWIIERDRYLSPHKRKSRQV